MYYTILDVSLVLCYNGLMSKRFSDAQKVGIFKNLAADSLYVTGMKFNFDKYYSSKASISTAVSKIFNEVKNDPAKFGVLPETVEVVQTAVESRVHTNKRPVLREQETVWQKDDIKGKTLSARDRSLKLINEKLLYLEEHPKALKNESLITLSKVYGTLFDKAQILSGEATEHIAHMAKIESDMNPDDAMNLILKMRENNLAKE